MSTRHLAALLCVMASAQAKVVINEISYHPPNDNDALEFIELFNSGSAAVDLAGWKFTKGIKYDFPQGAQIEGNGFLVLARDGEAFQNHYGFAPAGTFKSVLKNGGENLELSDAQGDRVDKVNYKDDSPWPLSADGETATLERICPDANGDDAANWASSPLSKEASKPAGTPGRQNANFSATLPPVLSQVVFEPKNPRPGQPVNVSSVVRDATDLQSIEVVYYLAGSGVPRAEKRVPMKPGDANRYTASIPAQPENSLVRFRIEAVNKSGGRRIEPGVNEPLPAFSFFVCEKFSPEKISRGFVIHANEADFKRAQRRGLQQGGTGAAGADQKGFMARMNFEMATEFSPIWTELCLTQQLSHAQFTQLQQPAQKQMEKRDNLAAEVEGSDDPVNDGRELMLAFHRETHNALAPALNDAQRSALSRWQQTKTNSMQQGFTPETLLQRLCNVEGAFLFVSARAQLDESGYNDLKSICARWIGERQKLVEIIMAAMQGRGDRVEAQTKMETLNSDADKEFAALLPDDAARREFAAWREETNPFRMRPPGARARETDPVRGANAFVYIPAGDTEPELYDFIEVRPRGGGYKIHFAKRRPLQEMSAINLIFEYQDRFVLAEALAYEVYRKAGNAAPKAEFVRLQMDDRPFGYHLLVEQPNRAFLKRNKLRNDGNLYKLLWYERGAERQHEKKTDPDTGHGDLLELLDALERTSGDQEWAVIKKHFNVEQVINYFAVNMVLSHWDGYFNNYFTYHDVNGTGKWEMYPWDQDKTWGFHDSLGEGSVFYDMPVTFGMEGDRPPGQGTGPAGLGFNPGTWWRPGGFFSKPLLANPEFRKHFLARTREILEMVYTEKEFFPIIDGLKDRLSEEVRIRADLLKENPDVAMARFDRNLKSLKEHLVKRREFLLAQEEIKNAGRFDGSALK